MGSFDGGAVVQHRAVVDRVEMKHGHGAVWRRRGLVDHLAGVRRDGGDLARQLESDPIRHAGAIGVPRDVDPRRVDRVVRPDQLQHLVDEAHVVRPAGPGLVAASRVPGLGIRRRPGIAQAVRVGHDEALQIGLFAQSALPFERGRAGRVAMQADHERHRARGGVAGRHVEQVRPGDPVVSQAVEAIGDGGGIAAVVACARERHDEEREREGLPHRDTPPSSGLHPLLSRPAPRIRPCCSADDGTTRGSHEAFRCSGWTRGGGGGPTRRGAC